MAKHFSELVEKEMSRKDFLKFLIGGAFMLFGVSNLVSYLTQYKTPEPDQATDSPKHGFGASKFGA